MDDLTINLTNQLEKEDVKKTLRKAMVSLHEDNYNAIEQMGGYLMTGEPSYLSRYNNVRNDIKGIGRDIILEVLLEDFLADE